MVIDAFLACLFNVYYLIFLSMVHEYAYFLWIYLEIGLFGLHHIEVYDSQCLKSETVPECHNKWDPVK